MLFIWNSPETNCCNVFGCNPVHLMNALPATIVAVDVETTGFYSDDRIVTLGAWRFNAHELGADFFRPQCLHIIADPGKKSHPKAEEVHGYSDWTLRYQQPFSEHAQTVRDFIASGDIVVAHNASFDLEFIDREYRALGQPTLPYSSYCTMEGYRQSGLPGRASLNAICQVMGLSRVGQKHGALEDAWLALMVYFCLNQVSARCIVPFAEIAKIGAPIVPTNFRQPPPLPEGQVPTRRAVALVKTRELTAARKAAKTALMRAVRPTAILLLEVARSGDSLAAEEIDVLANVIQATRDRLALLADSEVEQEVLAELLDVGGTQNLLTRASRSLCDDDVARQEFPKWLATIATVDGSVSEQERAAIDRVKSAIKRVLPQAP